MATLANRAAMERTFGLFKQSFSLIRSFSAAAPSSTPNAAAAATTTTTTSKKPKRKKKKNLFEVAQFLPNWGLGYQMSKTHWTDVSYEITKINLYKDGRHGKAWGLVHKNGIPAAEAPKKISGVHKRCWRYIPKTTKSLESTEKPQALECTEKPQAQAS